MWVGSLCAGSAFALDLDEVFPVARPNQAEATAQVVVADAFANLFDFEGAARVESTQQATSGRAQRSVFEIYRKSLRAGERRVLIVTADPEVPAQRIRMLEVSLSGTPSRTRVFIPRIRPEPMNTSYRITDPFLGTSSNLPAEEVRADLVALARAYEIVARESGDLEGEPVDRITIRPLAARRVERVELWLARDAPLILEYRYYEGDDPAPARVVRVPRAEMVAFAGRVLPGLMLYEDRLDGTVTRLELRYAALPPELGEAPFLESSFHRAVLPE